MPKQTQTTTTQTNTRTPATARPAPVRAAPAAEPLVQRAVADPASLSAQEVFQLQRQFGNQAVSSLLNRPVAQRAAPEEDEALQRSAEPLGLAGGPVAGELESRVQRAVGHGHSLPDAVRAKMEGHFQSDFSGVKVHTDSEAHDLNRSLGARAFTTGRDVFFKAGEYQPASSDGQSLLAHELTHVVQQGGALRRQPSLLGSSFTKSGAIQRAGEVRPRSNSAPPTLSSRSQPPQVVPPTPTPTPQTDDDNGPVGDDSLDDDNDLLTVTDQLDDDDQDVLDDDDTTTTTTTTPTTTTGGGSQGQSVTTPPTSSSSVPVTPGLAVVIPTYPSALSESEWRRNRPLKAKLGRDEVGIQLGLVASAHKGVLWLRFDVAKNPPQDAEYIREAVADSAAARAATDKATDATTISDARDAQRTALETATSARKAAEAALGLARNEFSSNIVVLLGQAGMLRNLLTAQIAKSASPYMSAMLAALTPYLNQLQSLEKAFVSYQKAIDHMKELEAESKAALEKLRQQEADSDESGLTGDLDGLGDDEEDEGDNEPAQRQPVGQLVGPKFYVELDQVRFYREPDTMQWLQSPDVTISAKDNVTKNGALASLQTKGKFNLLTFKDAVAALKAMRNQVIPPEIAAKNIVAVWTRAANSYSERVGFLGVHRQWKRQQLSLAGSQGKYAAWEEKYSKAAQLTERLGEVLLEDQDHIEELGGEVTSVSRTTGARPRRGSMSV